MSERWLVILALLAIGAYQIAFPGFAARGEVVDQATGRPLAGVTMLAPRGASATSDASGGALLWLRPGEVVTFQARGYAPARAQYWPWQALQVALVPAPTAPAPAAPATSPATPTPSVAAAPARLTGVVLDAATGRPIPGALLTGGGTTARSDDTGSFSVAPPPAGQTLRVLMPGYRRGEVAAGQGGTLEVKLQPFEARGLYLTYYAANDRALRDNVLKLLAPSGLNAVVIDIKGDRGFVAYPSRVPLAEQIGANTQHTIPDVEGLLRQLKAQGIYTIARIVVFKDDRLGRNGKAAGVDVAIKNAQTGGPWVDGEGLAWVDPTQERAWDYNVALAREAAEKGFDEVQLDYIRFPTDPAGGSSVSQAQFSRPLSADVRVGAITTFLERARAAVNGAGAYLSVDTFGYTAWSDDDMGIGQYLPTIAEHVDYISPMVYPSTFAAGLPKMTPYPDVVKKPHLVVYESMLRAHQRVDGHGALLRPWLQYFDDYPWATGMPYGASEIAEQVKAARETGCAGFLLWDPSNTYKYGAVAGQP